MPDPAASGNPQVSSQTACGSRPKLVAIGIAPLGIISIGIVPMGVISIGVVPMGVLSIGAVAMGVINASVVGMGILIAGVNVMGVWWVGMEGMGPFRLEAPGGQVHHHHDQSGRNQYAYQSQETALKKAKELGCVGVHAMGSLWMPCIEHPEE
ncbi:MAG: hypothetical protein WAM11_09240 [Cyanobium sp.]